MKERKSPNVSPLVFSLPAPPHRLPGSHISLSRSATARSTLSHQQEPRSSTPSQKRPNISPPHRLPISNLSLLLGSSATPPSLSDHSVGRTTKRIRATTIPQ